MFHKYFKEIKDEDEIEIFFHQYAIGDLLFYRETLYNLYGVQKRNPKIREKKLDRRERADLVRIKTELYNHLKKMDWTLNDLFRVLDKNNDREVSYQEFLDGMKKILSSTDADKLFHAIDIDDSKSLTMDEVSQELQNINAAIVLDSIKSTL